MTGVQVVSEPEICQGAGFKLRADARVLVHRPLRICLGCRSKSKKCDKQLTHIVRVIVSCNLKIRVKMMSWNNQGSDLFDTRFSVLWAFPNNLSATFFFVIVSCCIPGI